MSGPGVGGLPLGAPPIDRTWLDQLLGSFFEQEQRVYPLGYRDIGGNQSIIRFRAARACQYVRYHVQHSGQGGDFSTRGLFTRGLGRHGTRGLYARGLGIGPSGVTLEYVPGGAFATARVDCRDDRQQEVTITKDGTNRYVVFLIPEFLEADGTFTMFDGDDAEDHMAMIYLGV